MSSLCTNHFVSTVCQGVKKSVVIVCLWPVSLLFCVKAVLERERLCLKNVVPTMANQAKRELNQNLILLELLVGTITKISETRLCFISYR